MVRNPAFRDPAGAWRSEFDGRCGCCNQPFHIGDLIQRDHQLRVTVISGHESQVTR